MSEWKKTPQALYILDEIAFWKKQEAEHTTVILKLLPNLEQPFVEQLQAWTPVFRHNEKTAQEWKAWLLETNNHKNPHFQTQFELLRQSSIEQSEEFIKQLEQMKANSKAIGDTPDVLPILQHIQNESRYAIDRFAS